LFICIHSSITLKSTILITIFKSFIPFTQGRSFITLFNKFVKMVAYSSLLTFGLLAVADLVAGHGAIIAATGDAGGSGSALGIDSSTPRDGTRRRPFQQDTTRFQGDAAETFGETLQGGDNDPEAGTAAIMAESGDELPQITPGGEVQMTLHQVNGDGAGPYTCMINDDGTGTTWTEVSPRN
jgi:hypothetical protein